MMVNALIRFRDLDKDVIREPDDEWEVTKKRAEELFGRGFVEEVKAEKPKNKKERE